MPPIFRTRLRPCDCVDIVLLSPSSKKLLVARRQSTIQMPDLTACPRRSVDDECLRLRTHLTTDDLRGKAKGDGGDQRMSDIRTWMMSVHKYLPLLRRCAVCDLI